MTQHEMHQPEQLKETIIDKLMKLGIYKIQDLQLYQVPLFKLIQTYEKYAHEL